MNALLRTLAFPAIAVLLAACSDGATQPSEDPPAPPGTPVTVTEVARDAVRVYEATLGSVVAKQAPTVAAEVAARVVRVHVDEGDSVEAGQVLAELDDGDFLLARDRAGAEIQRLTALIENQQRQLERSQRLRGEGFVGESDLDSLETELRALRQQLSATRTQFAQAERNLARTRVTAPVAGQVETRQVDEGDWAGVGEPLFRITAESVLRAHLPFPEHVAELLRPGLVVELRSPAAPDAPVEGKLLELRPSLGSSRAATAIVEFENPGGWRPGASVDAAVVITERPEGLLVPEISVVQRPAGQVVYVVEDDRVSQRLVRVGVRQNGMIEILEGLAPGTRVVADGAGFLTDGARIQVREPQS
jgi:RND family efflux transporter MFP subunit